MRPLAVVPLDPPRDLAAGVIVSLEPVLPHAHLFEASEEPLDQSVLLRSVRRDKLLLKAVIPTRRTKPSALEDQPVVASHLWTVLVSVMLVRPVG